MLINILWIAWERVGHIAECEIPPPQWHFFYDTLFIKQWAKKIRQRAWKLRGQDG
jgi:hypothetical protein